MANGRNLSPEMMAQVKDYLRRKTGSSPRPKLRPGTTSPRPRLRPSNMSAIDNKMGLDAAAPNARAFRMSDADRQRAMDRAGMLEALEAGETGMGMSDADMNRLLSLLGAMSGGAGGAGRAAAKAGRSVTGMKKGGVVRKKKPKNGCTMKGRGGKYKGMK